MILGMTLLVTDSGTMESAESLSVVRPLSFMIVAVYENQSGGTIFLFLRVR